MKSVVVIPTHDRDAELERAVVSALRQTAAPSEVIVVDDVPRVETKTLVRRLASESGVPVRYLENRERRGAATSRNLAVAAATQGVVASLDDDDSWHPSYLENALRLMEQEAADLVLTARLDVAPDGSVSPGKVPPGIFSLQKWLLQNPGGTPSSIVVRRAAYQAVGGFDERLSVADDRDFVVRLVLAGYRYAAAAEPLVYKSSADPARLTGVVGRGYLRCQLIFYLKHWRRYRPRTHLRQWAKLVRLTTRAVRRLPP